MDTPNKIFVSNDLARASKKPEMLHESTEYIRKDVLLGWAEDCRRKIESNLKQNPNYDLATKSLMFSVFIDQINSY